MDVAEGNLADAEIAAALSAKEMRRKSSAHGRREFRSKPCRLRPALSIAEIPDADACSLGCTAHASKKGADCSAPFVVVSTASGLRSRPYRPCRRRPALPASPA